MNALNILLAEDNRGDVLLVREALSQAKLSYELHLARDGGEALDFVSRIGQTDGVPCPDIVLLDLNLPKVDGIAVLTEFRRHPLCATTPVIVITSSDATRDRARMGGLGVTRYFRKPSDLDAFMQLGTVVRQVAHESGLA